MYPMVIDARAQAMEELRHLLVKHALEVRPVTLSSGKQSDYYIDGKRLTMHQRGVLLCGELLLKLGMKHEIDAVGGLETGAIPLTVAILYAAQSEGIALNGFWVRKESKKHGMMRDIEGLLEPGMRVVIVDDVVTTGDSIIKAVEKVREAGCNVVGAIAVVDREEGAMERFREAGIPFEVLFKASELLTELNDVAL